MAFEIINLLTYESHGRPFSRPGKSWKTAKVMESHEK